MRPPPRRAGRECRVSGPRPAHRIPGRLGFTLNFGRRWILGPGLRAWLYLGAQVPDLPRLSSAPALGVDFRGGSAWVPPLPARCRTEPCGLTTQFPCLPVAITPSVPVTLRGTVRQSQGKEDRQTETPGSLRPETSPRRGARPDEPPAALQTGIQDCSTGRLEIFAKRLTPLSFQKAMLFFWFFFSV